MRVSGSWVIASMLVVALGMAGFSLWRRHAVMRNALQFWGPERALLLQRADRVELSRLTPADGAQAGDSEILTLQGAAYFSDAPQPIIRLPGVLHLQTYLIEDRSYDWRTTDGDPANEWRYVFRFSHSEPPFSADAAVINLAATANADRLHVMETGETLNSTPLAPFIRDVLKRANEQQDKGKAAAREGEAPAEPDAAQTPGARGSR